MIEASRNHVSLFELSLQSQVVFQVFYITVIVVFVAWQLEIDGDERTFGRHENNIVRVLYVINEVIWCN